MQLHGHAEFFVDEAAASPSATCKTSRIDTAQLPSFLRLLASLPNELQLNTTSRLYPLDLQDLSLSCRAARDMVYSVHVTKLTFTSSNMQKLLTRATMSERYPAVSQIAVNYMKMDQASSAEDIQGASECLRSLIHQNSEETMSGITHLDLTLTNSRACRRSFTKLAGLLRICTSLKRLEVRCVLPNKRGNGDFTVVLVLVEQVPGRGLQHHHDLLDHGTDLGRMLGSAACRTEMSQLLVGDVYGSAAPEAVTWALGALPHLSTLHDLAVHTLPVGSHIQVLTSLSQLTTLTHLDVSLPQSGSVELDLPALRQLTYCGGNHGRTIPLCFSHRMQSLTCLTLDQVWLQPTSNIQGLQSLQQLTLKACMIENDTSFLTSDIQALPGLTHLRVHNLRCSTAGQDMTHTLYCDTLTQLVELSLTCTGNVAIPSVPSSLTSLSVDVQKYRGDAVGLPASWFSLPHLTRLTFSLLYPETWDDWRRIFPVVAQMTSLQHLRMEMEMRPSRTGAINSVVVDPSCLDSLTRLTYLKVSTRLNDVNLDTPQWPRLVQAARLQHLAIWGSYDGFSTLSLPPSLVELQIKTKGNVQLPHALSNCSLLRSLRVDLRGFDFGDSEADVDDDDDIIISGISRLSPLASLIRLELDGPNNVISEGDLATTAALSSLQRLVLTGTISGSIHCLTALRQLTQLGLPDKYEELALLRTARVFPRLKEVP